MKFPGDDVQQLAEYRYRAVNGSPGEQQQFKVRVACGVEGRIEVRLDPLSSTAVAGVPVSNTGGRQTWTTETADVSGITGTYAVYLPVCLRDQSAMH
ncbi:carbohydrate-binding protein [Streptomyces sp. NPDC006463]|uniref:carbohydrate-binding protein n=1 Tax=Streptomyces sp. NPDC006463 TaxID=3364746 RepID=UPI0036959EC7